ncbi:MULTISPECIES: phosphatase PAP2 family protein [unclassified Streptomyces]|uniref:phosphatase PAP2 family protein n=1 Tax=unclassified Streptomyces TaxID=2593676 RepID=UPI002E0F4661|nr:MULTISPECIES: phosphatase PAP2 family protein [unclassified Streptomyces]WSR26723.1 phosphatase PAP2 family protein [Streptomyces sp. NBC_01205]
MAGLTSGGPNVDVSLLYDVNGLARHAPAAVDRAVGLVGAYGIPLALVLLFLWCWHGMRRQEEPTASESFAALVWAPLAAALALLLNVPLRALVARPRPYMEHDGLDVLAPHSGPGDFSFVSGHATLAMALGVGLFLANRKLGLIGIGLALAEGVCRVYLGVHYPTDVIGGFALGTAVVLVLAPLAMALLTPVVRAVARSPRAGRLVRAKRRALPRPVDLAQPQTPPPACRPHESDLAA